MEPPDKIEDAMAFKFERRYAVRLTRWGMETPAMRLEDDGRCGQLSPGGGLQMTELE